MKATGIVRRIDDLGRVVIPKEIRRTMRIREGDPLEIFVEDGQVIYKKYSPLGELGTVCRDFAESMCKAISIPVIICDTDHVIFVSGLPRREILERRVSGEYDDAIKGGKPFEKIQPIEGCAHKVVYGAPIFSSGDRRGAIMFITDQDNSSAGEKEIALINMAAQFLGRQMEV